MERAAVNSLGASRRAAKPDRARRDSRGDFGLCDPRCTEHHRRISAPDVCREHIPLVAAGASEYERSARSRRAKAGIDGRPLHHRTSPRGTRHPWVPAESAASGRMPAARPLPLAGTALSARTLSRPRRLRDDVHDGRQAHRCAGRHSSYADYRDRSRREESPHALSGCAARRLATRASHQHPARTSDDSSRRQHDAESIRAPVPDLARGSRTACVP